MYSATEDLLWSLATLAARGLSVVVVLAAALWAMRKIVRILRGEAFLSD